MDEEYKRNTDEVLAYMAQKARSEWTMRRYRECFDLFGSHLQESGKGFSGDAAWEWFESELAHHREVARAPGESGRPDRRCGPAQPEASCCGNQSRALGGRRHADVRLLAEPDVGRHVVARGEGRVRSGSGPDQKSPGWIPLTS